MACNWYSVHAKLTTTLQCIVTDLLLLLCDCFVLVLACRHCWYSSVADSDHPLACAGQEDLSLHTNYQGGRQVRNAKISPTATVM